MTWVKVCGVREPADVEAAVEAGADAIGFVIAANSIRRVPIERARVLAEGVPIIRVLVTMDLEPGMVMDAAVGMDAVQPHGAHAAAAGAAARAAGLVVLRPIPMTEAPDLSAVPEDQIPMLDSPRPGTGIPFDWKLMNGGPRRFVMAGGLGPDNVAEAIRAIHPWGVDASSGLEAEPGRKDPVLIRRFVEEARRQ
jgi:phosphoribosylanthranilate isomerase